ncbi:MAG: mononuclear molybdenum enzyme YedY [Thiobacillus sp. 63-78]|uniref:protein-methionine-sulfoxide reductase catalytic subunit MsrP n=1 Tax=Thiobacillus sp. 63-78 TaxID=1895859 RepID=UPI000967F3BD|nr:protein-methionine-sulfoxide reductase catalytic subunit MsrP [Thiobacillus sp. 63-78]MBN8764639.1 protein-methionine-sulfoxide reductase catalytic subunit MsrP [Thiobacillus sp.]MBN8772990.1 protein-methionine-sulfoxide reductase catalytic subunit MsrP [Thiobacillus sp.]OJZ07835.1 MAG: mononuclear molybdenum enzyme YedY [Thiobacillus sp. 63-78]
MSLRSSRDIPSLEITPPEIYRERRLFMQGMGVMVAGTALGITSDAQAGAKLADVHRSPYTLNEEKTPYKAVTTYNNFYEFGPGKSDPAERAGSLKTRPWTVKVEGEAGKPGEYDIDSLLKLAPLEERVYRLRCVEGWSMVIPWIGFPLSELIRRAAPTSRAKYVEFVTLDDPGQMPGQRSDILDWPYVEGLRMDEAMHPLAILAVGLYGEVLPNQNGAPVRLVVPWKYGFKSAKSIVRIRFVEKQPLTAWMRAAPREYGFYSNVNPHVDHPRWSQAKERRIGEFLKRDTLMFNGYGAQVAQLYRGMDLQTFF